MLDLVWFAAFKNEELINQFDDAEQTKEHSFKEVLDRQNDLRTFALVNINSAVVYAVNLEEGTINVSLANTPQLETDEDMKNDTNQAYRLIYFRRVSRNFTSDFKEIGEATVVYFLGFQYLDKNNKNHKRLMKIHSDGRFIIN